MSIRIVLVALIALIFSVPLVLAGTVTRSFSEDVVEPGGQLTITLVVDAVASETYFTLDEIYPLGWTVINNGGLNKDEFQHLKVVIYQDVYDTQYQYTIQAPSCTGTATWSGEYIFEGMTETHNIGGDSQVTLSCSLYPESTSCEKDTNCEWCPQCSGSLYSGDSDRCVETGNCQYVCKQGICDAGCDSDTGCASTDCDYNDGCYSGTYRDYSNAPNICQDDCSCTTNSCSSYTETGTDQDGDCYDTECGDCDDSNPDIRPGATEICDGYDNNCDEKTDYFIVVGDLTKNCGPQNETGVCQFGSKICSGGTWGICKNPVYPETETCNQLDDDCNGVIDDVRGGVSIETTRCQCYDNDPPLSQERCPHNSIDDDCNGVIDDYNCGCTPGETRLCALQDGVCTGSQERCPAGGMWLGCNHVVYEQHDNSYESGSETSCDSLDNNCDSSVDEDLIETFYRDFDGDGYGDATNSIESCSLLSGYTTNQLDCDDEDADINPGATEICNSIDDDCDSNVDFITSPGDINCVDDIIIIYDYYDGLTTDFKDVNDTTNIINTKLEKIPYGMIEFLEPVNISNSVNLNPPNTRITENLVAVNPDRFPFLDHPARITLWSIDFLNPVILMDDESCPSSICQIIDYSGDKLVFNVTGFSEYSITGSCSDGTLYGRCSTQKPGYCLNGILVSRAYICGCPIGYYEDDNDCNKDDENIDGESEVICNNGDTTICSMPGVCRPSYQTCVNGFWGSCEGPPPETEICDNFDNDCDGEVDDGIICSCVSGDTRVCGPSTETGVCKLGVSTCEYNQWSECEGDVMPSVEMCDSLDNDCDGEVDEECASDICEEGMITSDRCLCGGNIRTSGYCCSGLYYKNGCPFQWSLLILTGAIMLIILYAVVLYLKSKDKELTWKTLKKSTKLW